MEYNLKQHIDFLLEHACTSIRYIVHRNMLKTSVDEPFMEKMQAEILGQANHGRADRAGAGTSFCGA